MATEADTPAAATSTSDYGFDASGAAGAMFAESGFGLAACFA